MAATAPAMRNDYRQDFERFLAGRSEPESMLTLRRTALERFESLGMPNLRQEAWRLTDLGAFAQTRFSRAGEAPVDPAGVPPAVAEAAHRLVFVNGRHNRGLSRTEALPEGVIIGSLAEALRTAPEIVEAHLDRLPGLEDHPFVALNTAFLEDGAFVFLPRGAVLEVPLHFVFLATGNDTVSYPRNLIVLEDASQAVVVEDYRGDGRYWASPVSEIEVGDGAVIEHHRIQQEDTRAWHLGALRLRQGRDSHATLHTLTSGALLSRTDVAALLDGEGADCTLNGLTLVDEGQLGDYHLRVEHAKPHGTSRQLFKGVLAGKSRAVFNGLIYVRQDAQKTDALQSNRNLLLSKRAIADSNPRLEILADDVKCNHGSSIGYLDPDALFYLRSRGIGELQARSMLVYAFANDIIERIRLAPLRERLEKLLVGRLHPDAPENQMP